MFSLSPSSLRDKAKIRDFILLRTGLSAEDLSPFLGPVTLHSFKRRFNSFSSKYPEAALQINAIERNGIGSGELLSYFLFDNVTLGGKNSTCDLWLDDKPFLELKGGRYTQKTHSICDFKLHRDQDASAKFISAALDSSSVITIDVNAQVWTNTRQLLGEYGTAECDKKVCEFLSARQAGSINTTTRSDIIQTWVDMIHAEYLQGKTFCLIDAKKLVVKYIGPIRQDMVTLDRIHRNQPYAKVYI